MKTPFPHQLEASKWLAKGSMRYLAFGARCGKTLAAVLGLLEVKAQRSVIVCPLGVIGVWAKEMREHGMDVGVYVGTAGQKRKAFNSPHLIINYESIWRIGLSLTEMDVVIFDEAHRVSNMRSRVSQYFMSTKGKRAWLLSGTPMIESTLQLAGQLFATDHIFMGWVDPHRYLWTNWHWNEMRYKFEAVDRNHPKEIADFFSVTASKKTAEELGLPARLYEEIEVTPTKCDLERIERNTYLVLAPALRDMREQMAVGGWDNISECMSSSAKSEELKELIAIFQEQNESVLICCRFVEEVRWISKLLNCKAIWGETPLSVREQVRLSLGTPATVVVTQVQTIKLGLDFSAANVQIFYSNDWSGETRAQAEDRTRNITKSTPSRIIDLVCGDVDKRVAATVRKKENYNHKTIRKEDKCASESEA